MIKLVLLSSIFLEGLIGFQNPNKVSDFYTSGIDDKTVNQEYYPPSSYAVVSFPFNFRTNNFNDPLPAGHYQLVPVYKNEIPALIKVRRTGEIVGIITVVDFKELTYIKTKPDASIELINHGKMAQVKLKSDKFEIFGLIEMVDLVP